MRGEGWGFRLSGYSGDKLQEEGEQGKERERGEKEGEIEERKRGNKARITCRKKMEESEHQGTSFLKECAGRR